MRAIWLEGDPADVAEALKKLGASPEGIRDGSAVPEEDLEVETDEDESELEFCSTPVAKKVLTRRSLAPLQKKMLIAVYDAGDSGILGSELARKLGYSTAQFRGMMGAWGRRLVNTPGYREGSHFFDWNWEEDPGSYRYWLPPAVREAVRAVLVERN